jgi:GWxTD domain-containing protein
MVRLTMERKYISTIFAFAFLFFINILRAQEIAQSNKDSILVYAENLIFLGRERDADKLLSTIKNEESKTPEEKITTARIALLKFDLIGARDIFEGIVKENPDNMDAYYYLGIACRDLAFKKSWQVHKVNSFKRANECFEKILRHDRTYKDICLQYGLYLDYTGKTTDAINMILEQIKLKPGMTDSYFGIRNIVLRKILENKSGEKIEDIIDDFNNIKDENYRNYFRGEFFRVKGFYPEAEKCFLNLLKEDINFPKILVYCALLKMYSKSEDKKKVENLFFEAMNSLKTELDAEILFHDLKYIAHPKEILKYEMSSFLEIKNKYFLNFWERHNPNRGMKDNPRIYEHYKRLAEAEDKYYLFREGFYYVKNKFDEYSDQGLIYIRFGIPDKIIISSGSGINDEKGNLHESAHDPALYFYEKDPYEIASNMHSNLIETWYYFSNMINPQLEFNFWGKNKKFLTYIADKKAIVDRSFFMPVDETMKMDKILSITREYGSDPNLDENKYNSMIQIGLAKEKSTIEKDALTFNIPVNLYSFRSSTGGTAIDLPYMINKSYIFDQIPDTIKELKSEFIITIYDQNKNKIFIKTDTIILKRPDKNDDAEFRFNKFDLKPDSCEILLTIHPIDQEIFGRGGININIPDYANKKLMISDIETGLEKKNGSDIFKKAGRILLPKANSAHNLKTPLGAYYEIYNLKKNSDGKTMYKMEYNIKYTGSENIINKIFSSGDRKNSISMEYFQTGKEETAKEFISFELNKLIPGKYILEVKITDVYASKTVIQNRDIELYEN